MFVQMPKKKRTSSHISNPKGRTKRRNDAKASRSKSVTLLPGYILARKIDAWTIRLCRNTKYNMVMSPIPKGVLVQGDMMGMLETFTTLHTHFGQFGLVKPLS